LRQLLLDGSASEPGYSWDLVNLSDLDLGYELNGYLPGLVNVYVTMINNHYPLYKCGFDRIFMVF
jgi:hypothetical protein